MLKRRWIALALMLAALMSRAAAADMQVYVGDMSPGAAQRLTAMLAAAFPQQTWTYVCGGEESLREMVLSDCAPQLAVCAPKTVRRWAAQGLLAPMDGLSDSLSRMQRQVVEACVHEESLFMLPLAAQQRQMAVNIRMMQAQNMGYLLSRENNPVWYPSQLYQVLEEFMLKGETALDVWPAAQQGEGIAAFVQALYGGFLTDGRQPLPDAQALAEAMDWVGALTRAGMIGYADSREQALERFIAGETAIFIDWSPREEALYAQQLEEQEIAYALLPYPSSLGRTVRAWELTGVCVFMSDGEKTQLALEAAAYLSAQAAGMGALWADGALWLPCHEGARQGATASGLFEEAMEAVLERGADAWEEVQRMRSAVGMLP